MINKSKKYKKLMADARDYESWKDAALELDYIDRNVDWKEAFASDLYNYELIYDRLSQLRECSRNKDHDLMLRCLREGLHHDLGNMGNSELYNRSNIGTKHLIEEYINQVCESLNYICNNDIPELTDKQKLDFFKDTLLSYGRPALLLSGGASLGMFHIGVIKALWERDLLPQVVAGSSVGSIMAAMLGTHTDAELPEMLDPNRHNLKAWKWLGIMSGLKGKGFMDQKQLESCLRTNIGEYSFQEAYERTGRSINITVSPVHEHQKERLLSGFTSPYLSVWSASLASCSVPGIFPPVKLMKKDIDGNLVPYMSRLRWVDGSVVSDLPVERLMHLYDVNFSIVSQTNPHIVPFMEMNKKRKRNGPLSLPARIIKSEVQFHGKATFDYLRNSVDNELFRQVSGHMYSIMAQNYYGDVTVAPHYTLRHYMNILRNPSPDLVKELILQGEKATWPKLAMIRTHAKISQTLENCISRLKVKATRSKAELRIIAS